MFRKNYHMANDDIPVNEELLNTILEKDIKKNKPAYPRSTVAASLVILTLSVAVYPLIFKNTSTPSPVSIPEHTILPIPSVSESPTPLPKTKHPVQESTENEPTVKNPSHATEKPVSRTDTKPKKTKAPETSKPQNTPEQKPISTIPPQESEPSTQEEVNGDVKGVTSDEITQNSLVTEVWTEADYFEYIGREINPVIPDDLDDISQKERNMTLYSDTDTLCYDMWILNYASEDTTRTISIKLSRSDGLSEKFQNISYSEELSQAKLNDLKVLIDVNAINLSEEEFNTLCNSLKENEEIKQ